MSAIISIRIDNDDEENGKKKRVRERSKSPTELRRSRIIPKMVKSLLSMSKKIFSCYLLKKSAREGSIDDEYRFSRLLSEQNERKVRVCYNKKKGTAFCCKTIRKTKSYNNGASSVSAGICNEVEIMRHLSDYPGIVKLHAVYQNPRDEFIHLVMELCSGGDLYYALEKNGRPFTESQAATFFKQIMQSIQYCHEKGVMHCDIKLENVFLADNNVVKLGDFGLARFFTKGQLYYNDTGSLFYRAPEMVEYKGYWEAADIWSAGIILYTMLAGQYPFNANEIATKNLNLQSHVWSQISYSAKNLISGILNKNPVRRLTISDILEHPWFQEVQPAKNHELDFVIKVVPR